MPDFNLEDQARREGHAVIAGVDEAGRGPWAGPVVAGAVILDPVNLSSELRRGLDDSKKLKPEKREDLLMRLEREARIGVGQADVSEIDSLNILQATLLAMARAVKDLGVTPDMALVDGNSEPQLACPVRCVVRGDGQSLSIAAASIAAKVTRDRIMAGLAETFPGYGWETNAGYGTKEHQMALDRLGVTPEHRVSYAPIKKILGR
ncbi:MAG: ribonuclease HII [Rhodospirillales bacterium]